MAAQCLGATFAHIAIARDHGDLARQHARDEAVPHPEGPLGQLDAALGAVVVDQAQRRLQSRVTLIQMARIG